MIAERNGTPVISVLVCTRNRDANIGKCVASILANPVREMELLVIDQSDGEATQNALESIQDGRLRYIRTPTRGLARARNVGVEASVAPIVLFTDDDCYAEETWVESFLEEFERNPSLDAVYGRVLPYGEGGPDQTCPTIMEATQPRLVEGLRWERVQEAVGHGNSMAFRRSCFERHGLFMEWLGAGTAMTGGEDTDFSFRVLRGGARIFYSPKPVAYHDNWMPIADSYRQLAGYMTSGSAVLTRFILRGSATALKMQLSYFRNYRKDMKWRRKQNDSDGLKHIRQIVRRHLVGIWYGIRYAFRRQPSYHPGQQTREWTELTPRRVSS